MCLAVVIHFRRDIFRAGLRQDRLTPRCSTVIPGALHWVPRADAADECFRLDQRRYVMPNRLGANGAAVAPGDSAKSRLYLKLTGSQNGTKMPPAGSLPAEQIEIVKAWIDQGAEWPDDLSGETPVSPADPKAGRLMEALRSGDRHAFRKMLRQDSTATNRRGPGGSTPL